MSSLAATALMRNGNLEREEKERKGCFRNKLEFQGEAKESLEYGNGGLSKCGFVISGNILASEIRVL